VKAVYVHNVGLQMNMAILKIVKCPSFALALRMVRRLMTEAGMINIFNPKCPYCGGKLKLTNYAAPFPQWKCPRCIKRNKEIRNLKDRISALEENLRSKNNA
jgi:hypothetical protein